MEGGWYKEALRTLMYVGNERTLKMMHGPGFSGKVLAADVPKGVYRYSDLEEAQLRSDWFWHFVPSVRSLHPRQVRRRRCHDQHRAVFSLRASL